jgi:hypothetical protein
MANDITVCFRTNSETINALEKIAREGGQSVSTVVESIIQHYFRDNRESKGLHQNHRCVERKKVCIPAFIGDPQWQRKDFERGKILDISFGGIQVAVPKGTRLEFQSEGNPKEISVIFSLEDCPWPIHLKCQPKRASESEEEILIGASLVDPDFYTYTTLQKYLI